MGRFHIKLVRSQREQHSSLLRNTFLLKNEEVPPRHPTNPPSENLFRCREGKHDYGPIITSKMYKRKEGIYVGRVEGGASQLPVFVPRRLAALLPIKRCIMSRYSFNSRKKESEKKQRKEEKKKTSSQRATEKLLKQPVKSRHGPASPPPALGGKWEPCVLWWHRIFFLSLLLVLVCFELDLWLQDPGRLSLFIKKLIWQNTPHSECLPFSLFPGPPPLPSHRRG